MRGFHNSLNVAVACPRATGKNAALSRRARACPSPSSCTRNPTLAGDRPPRYEKKRHPFTVGRGPVPRHRSGVRTPHPCRSRSPDPDLFVIRRSQTTDGETYIVTMEIAGDRPPRYEKKRLPHRRAGACPSPSCVKVFSNEMFSLYSLRHRPARAGMH